MSTTESLRVAVIAGSRRPHRRATGVAEWVAAGAPSGVTVEVIDLGEVALPTLTEPSPPMFGDYELEHTRSWGRVIDQFDAYVLVTPEYNHTTSPALSNALQHVYREWGDKAVGFVGYGVEGGVRAVEHLRQITAELGLAGVGPAVALNLFDDFGDDGACRPRERHEQQRERLWQGLRRWGGALRAMRGSERDAEPASGVLGATDGAGGRPRLGSPSPAADDAVAELVSTLQRGLDEGDADLYDSQLADDVLWGTPYGEVLQGYAGLNGAHRSMMTGPPEHASRYEPVQQVAVGDDLVLVQVRRGNRDEPGGDGSGGAASDSTEPTARFSEMALYALVRRAGRWWLAAGQNTPIRPKP